MKQLRETIGAATVVATLALAAFFVASRHDPQSDLNESLLRTAPMAPEQVRRLIDQGADVNTTDAMGMTPLMWASYKGKASTVELLLREGADPDAKSHDGYTALTLAAVRQRTAIVKLLKEGRRSGTQR